MSASPNNEDRAEWAREAQNAFDAIVYQGNADDVEALDTRIGDLIVDLLHLAQREAGVIDIEEFAARAVRHHADEVEEESNDGCATCKAQIETRDFPCDECGNTDSDE